ncbi:MAG TPA: beta-galactosidase, partial [Acholeplasmatales bacterium]|nr:beta-galactosidase [Acholeplasmatales bacterium]
SAEEAEIVVELRDGSDLKFQNRYSLKNGKAFAECLATDLRLWDISDPHLYDIKVALIKNREAIDEKAIRFGFRKAEFTKDGFFLNRQFLKLRGLNRHQSYPYVGYAMPKSAQIKDADILKYDLGVNIVRTSHYPVSRHFLDRCDEIGLLVFEEIPGWQHLGEDQFRANVLNDVRSMIERDRHHPSIILWGVRINESDDCESLYKATNALAKSLDDTRPTGGVRCIKNSQFLEDVYTYNDFTHAGGKMVLEKPRRVKKNVPYLVTEHNGHMFPTKRFDDEPHRVEQALRHYRVMEAAAKDPSISGTIGWCMNDYNTHNEFGSGDKICYHGVLDMFRLFKPAGHVYSSQGDGKPVLEVLTSLNSGEYPGSLLKEAVIATNCDLVKVYKDGRFIGDHRPDPKSVLSHPLLIITDFIGNLLEEEEKMSHRDAEFVKRLLRKIKNEDVFPLNLKVGMLYIMRKYHYALQAATGLYFKYTKSGNEWRFVGYKDGQPVKTVIKGKQTDSAYQIFADAEILRVGATFDTTRIVVRKVDQNQNLLDYAFEGAMVQTAGGIGLIGPNLVSLVGGELAFWVKTNQKGPIGTIKVTVGNQELTKQVKIEVE